MLADGRITDASAVLARCGVGVIWTLLELGRWAAYYGRGIG